MGFTGVCLWVVMGIVPIAIRSLALWGIVGIDEALRLNVTGSLGPGRKKLLLYKSVDPRSSLFILHFPRGKTLWLPFSPSLLLSVGRLPFGLLCVTSICLWWTLLLICGSLEKQQTVCYFILNKNSDCQRIIRSLTMFLKTHCLPSINHLSTFCCYEVSFLQPTMKLLIFLASPQDITKCIHCLSSSLQSDPS